MGKQQVHTEASKSKPLVSLSSPRSFSPARDQTICPVTDLWVRTDTRPGSKIGARGSGDGWRESEWEVDAKIEVWDNAAKEWRGGVKGVGGDEG